MLRSCITYQYYSHRHKVDNAETIEMSAILYRRFRSQSLERTLYPSRRHELDRGSAPALTDRTDQRRWTTGVLQDTKLSIVSEQRRRRSMRHEGPALIDHCSHTGNRMLQDSRITRSRRQHGIRHSTTATIDVWHLEDLADLEYCCISALEDMAMLQECQ